jgi:hypothetical protein
MELQELEKEVIKAELEARLSEANRIKAGKPPAAKARPAEAK